MGLPLSELYGMTLREFLAAHQGWRRARESAEREALENMRWQTCAIAHMLGAKSLTPQQLLPLPWDREHDTPPELVGGCYESHRDFLAAEYERLIEQKHE